MWAGLAVLASVGFINWIATRSEDRGVHWPLRRGEDATDNLMEEFFASYKLAPEFPVSQIASPARINPSPGTPDDPVPDDYKLTITDMGGNSHTLTLDQLKAMPSKTMVTQFCCIEGWSQIVQWTGVPLSELLIALKFVDLAKMDQAPKYVRMETAQGTYYVGWDLASALHPQTLLVYAMNGAPLEPEHGAPIRLYSPVKYGYKNIKWLTTIILTNDFPTDYWGDQGYDWYGGL